MGGKELRRLFDRRCLTRTKGAKKWSRRVGSKRLNCVPEFFTILMNGSFNTSKVILAKEFPQKVTLSTKLKEKRAVRVGLGVLPPFVNQ